MLGAVFKCLTVCLLYGGWNNTASSAYTEIGQGHFWTLNFDLKNSNQEDPNWYERSVGVLWWVEGRDFPSAANRCAPFFFYSEIPLQ